MAARTSALADLHFPAIILDEAQAIKNAGSARSRAIRSLHGERRIALSGTPVENNLNELWSLMEFLNPGLLGSRKSFESFTRSLERGYAPLRRLVRPFILRRMKRIRRWFPTCRTKRKYRPIAPSRRNRPPCTRHR